MFPPNNGKSLIVAGNLLVLLFNVLQIRSLKKQAAGMTGSGTPGGKVLFKKEDAYGSAFIAIVFIFIGTAMLLLEGLSAGEPTMDIDCSDPMTLLRTVLRAGILILPAFAVAISFPGEFFVIFEERIKWAKRKEKAHLTWSEVTEVLNNNEDNKNSITLKGPGCGVSVPEVALNLKERTLVRIKKVHKFNCRCGHFRFYRCMLDALRIIDIFTHLSIFFLINSALSSIRNSGGGRSVH